MKQKMAHIRRGWFLWIGGACFLVTSFAVCSSSAPAGAATSGPIQVLGTSDNGPVIVTGVIADKGTSVQVNANEKPSRSGHFHLWELKKGEILIDATQLAAAFRGPSVFNSTTCSGVLNASAPVPVIKGTKAYASITGSIDMSVSIHAILPTPCNPNGAGSPVTEVGFISGSGNVSY